MVNPPHPQEFLPEGSRLNIDRRATAKQVYMDVDEWKDKTNRVDLKHYDTRRPVRAARKPSGDDVIQDEPYRFLRPRTETRRIMDGIKDKFIDYEGFVKQVRAAFANDRGGLANLERFITSDASFKSLWETNIVREWLFQNRQIVGIKGLMTEQGISDRNARKKWRTLSRKKQQALIMKVLRGKDLKIPKVAPYKPRPPKALPRIKYVVKGKTYSRAIPQKWSKLQTIFLKNNKDKVKIKRLSEAYNRVFRENPRSLAAIRSKLKRV